MRRPTVALFLFCALVLACDEPSSPPAPSPNRAPTIDSVNVSPSSVTSGHPVEVAVYARDADGDALAYEYEPDGGHIAGSGPRVTWLPPGSVGDYGLSVRVRDVRGARASDRTHVSVVPPTLIVGEIVAVEGAGTLWGTMLLIYRDYRDYYEWRWAQPPTIVQSTNPFIAAFVIDVLEPGEYWIDAWQDVNRNGCPDGGDRYGVYRDAGHVESIIVPESRTTEVGQIQLRLSHSPPCAASPPR